VSPLFTYQWIDGSNHDVTIPDGDYDLGEFVTQFQNIMIMNGHYFTNRVSGQKEFAMNFAYDVRTDRIQIQCKAINKNVYSTAKYVSSPLVLSLTSYVVVPVIRVLANGFQQIIGTNAGYYPEGAQITTVAYPGGDGEFYLQPDLGAGSQTPENNIFNQVPFNTATNLGINQNFDGTMSPKIGTPYVPLYFKPSNSKFATQGSVDASSRLARLKYDTITSSASTFTTAYGRHTANALAYGVPGPGATFKERIGYSASCIPTASMNAMMKCTTTKIYGGN
jgi:hypothetical protein